MISLEKRNVADKWFHEYFTKGNVDILDELTTEDVVFHSRNNHDIPREGLKDFMKWYRSAFHDDEWVIEDLIEQDDKLVVRYTGWMTYKGGWFNLPSTNQRVKETGIMIFIFENGRVKEYWCENSDADVLFKLGGLPKVAHEVF